MGPNGVHQQRAAEGSRDGAEGERFNPDRMCEEDASKNGSHAVNKRGKGLHGELLAHEQSRSEYAPGKKAKLGREHDAREAGTESGLSGGESDEPPADVPGRSEFREQN